MMSTVRWAAPASAAPFRVQSSRTCGLWPLSPVRSGRAASPGMGSSIVGGASAFPAPPPAAAALEPTRLPGEIQFRAVGLGLSHACGLAGDSRVYCWGSNEFGELGVRPTGPRRPAPVPVTFPEGAAESFTSVGASPYDSCAVDEAGRGYCWGRSEEHTSELQSH